ncbi:MAG: YaaR family protein [Clostridiales bacterium]|jgi:uncharacterized protein YaaR (DUF327 family)|nr:YaaR family protein [Eubacteriales bacterium]MDH7566109.1 YaaR family protein [Clostridiales bacterium]
MKVRETMGKPPGLPEIAEKENKKVPGAMDASFHSRLKQVESRNFEEKASELVDLISRQGEKLSKKMDIRELKLYKSLIAEFLGLAVGNSYKFSKQNFLDRRGRHRVYAIIKKINEQLDLLTQDVLSEEKDNIGILKRLDDIRGLILDLMM